ncbi:MAG: MarR family transcriptional regulator [Desulfobacterales bacterium]|nr:MarR family transcriptional regulator [Desulfobacterales bacterium]
MRNNSRSQNAGQVLHDLFREVFALKALLAGIMDQVHLEAGLSTSQNRIMHALSQTARATVPDIAAALGVSRQFVQKSCNDLLERGFLAFYDNPRHKRSKHLALTAVGRAAYEMARRKEDEIIAKSLPDIEPGKAARATKLLHSIREALSLLPSDH